MTQSATARGSLQVRQTWSPFDPGVWSARTSKQQQRQMLRMHSTSVQCSQQPAQCDLARVSPATHQTPMHLPAAAAISQVQFGQQPLQHPTARARTSLQRATFQPQRQAAVSAAQLGQPSPRSLPARARTTVQRVAWHQPTTAAVTPAQLCQQPPRRSIARTSNERHLTAAHLINDYYYSCVPPRNFSTTFRLPI